MILEWDYHSTWIVLLIAVILGVFRELVVVSALL